MQSEIIQRRGFIWPRPVNWNRMLSLQRSYSGEWSVALVCTSAGSAVSEENSVSPHLTRALVKENEVTHKSEKEEIIVFKISYITTCAGERIWRRNNEAREEAAEWMINVVNICNWREYPQGWDTWQVGTATWCGVTRQVSIRKSLVRIHWLSTLTSRISYRSMLCQLQI
jgi:hypothetical protein